MGRNSQTFKVKDCAIITRMGGIPTAINLRELGERIAICSIESLYHHFCETLIRPSFSDPEFRNDFAIWAARHLRDRVLAERLGVLNPYSYENLEQLRMEVIDIIDERLSEVHYIPWVPRGEDFRFMQAATVIFDTGVELSGVRDLLRYIPEMSLSTIYYHFIEARRRTPMKTDDFTSWLIGLGRKPNGLMRALADLDFYFLSIRELKRALVEIAKSAGRGKRKNVKKSA